ncbi:transcriptional regulator [Escherichia coli]|nr:transcriptional regulator [Escherichia coli O11:H15]EFH7218149.1 transcriptional regulator [Escherichia coli]EGK4048965.1 transcriptional regulator [Escherichia coli]EGK4058556.1 transcriptional regulator [Escherichia coli]EII3576412.1 adhesin biosynthesis transcription regulatory family protein [Escherichia coli]
MSGISGGQLTKDKYTSPGSMSIEHFRCLIEISSINSRKTIMAMEDYFVHGKSRKEACERNNVAQSYFSISVKKFIKISNAVAQASKFYRR